MKTKQIGVNLIRNMKESYENSSKNWWKTRKVSWFDNIM